MHIGHKMPIEKSQSTDQQRKQNTHDLYWAVEGENLTRVKEIVAAGNADVLSVYQNDEHAKVLVHQAGKDAKEVPESMLRLDTVAPQIIDELRTAAEKQAKEEGVESDIE